MPVKQEALTRLLQLGTKEPQWLKPQDLLELVDKLVKRATALPCTDDALEVLRIDDTKVIELLFNLVPYLPPESTPLPQGYRPPKTAIASLYWKTWLLLLLLTAHNPQVDFTF